jgi:hypothetical protein
VTDLTSAVTAFSGSVLTLLPQALTVVKAEAKLDITILSATHIADGSAIFTVEESSAIVNS